MGVDPSQALGLLHFAGGAVDGAGTGAADPARITVDGRVVRTETPGPVPRAEGQQLLNVVGGG